jgi:hypothetical protein
MEAQQIIEHEGGTAPKVPEVQAEVRALAPQPVSASPLDLPAEVFRSGLDRRKENRAALMEWVRAALVEGVDYGRIHVVGKDRCKQGRHCQNPNHFSKPSLFKPGAEKICGMLGVTVHYPTLADYEQTALNGIHIQNVIIRCEIQDAAGRVVADGVGARSLKQDYGDINKALKMAEKSAHIDATLRMAGLSEVFTQDLEDMVPASNKAQSGKPATPSPSPQAGDPNGSGPVPSGENGALITQAQRKRLEARITELGLERERVKEWMQKASKGRVQSFDQLSPAMYRTLDSRLEQWAEQNVNHKENQ